MGVVAGLVVAGLVVIGLVVVGLAEVFTTELFAGILLCTAGALDDEAFLLAEDEAGRGDELAAALLFAEDT